MSAMTRPVTAMLAVLALAPGAAAQVVYDGGAPNGQPGWNIFNDTRAADDFEVAATLGFGAIRFWAILPTGVTPAAEIFWQFLHDDGGMPGGAVAADGLTPAAATLRGASAFAGFDSWQLDLHVGSHLLGPGVYWLALHDGVPGTVTFSDLIWEATAGGRGGDFAVEDFGIWTGGWDGNLAFALLEPAVVVPEPLGVLLLGTGLAGVAAALRRRRGRPAGR